MTRRRQQLVVFRLTDLEFAVLKRLCAAKGGRNLSEFARTELLGNAQSIEVAALHRQAAALERGLSRLENRCRELISWTPTVSA